MILSLCFIFQYNYQGVKDSKQNTLVEINCVLQNKMVHTIIINACCYKKKIINFIVDCLILFMSRVYTFVCLKFMRKFCFYLFSTIFQLPQLLDTHTHKTFSTLAIIKKNIFLHSVYISSCS